MDKTKNLKPRAHYHIHKSHAKRRGVPFLLTFEEWFLVWETSGKWPERGNKAHQYCMARKGDVGPYALGNVVIKTCRENNAEQKAHNDKLTLEQRAQVKDLAKHELYAVVAAKFGISVSRVGQIVRGSRN